MKIRWNRLAVLIIFIASSILILHDIYFTSIRMWFTGKTCGWTYFGFITFIIAIYVASFTFEKLKEWWDEV